VFFGHRAGFAVYRAGTWRTYGTTNGLSGRVVRAIEAIEEAVFFGTKTGLTVVMLKGSSPFERVDNWIRYYESAGLPSSSITALLVAGDVLWIGTDEGLVSASVAELVDGDPTFSGSPLSIAVTALEENEGTLYVGTQAGVYSYVVASGEVTLLPGTGGESVNDLLQVGETLYVASDRGLRGYRSGIGVGWLTVGETVHAVGSMPDGLAYGTEAGLVLVGSGDVRYTSRVITALEEEDGALWVGSRANADYRLIVWRLTETEEVFTGEVTGIEGRDPYSYLDVDAEEHTSLGTTAQASFRHASENLAIAGAVEVIAPTYRALGSNSRRDSIVWDLSASLDLAEETVIAFTHDYELTNRLGERPQSTLENTVSFSGVVGPEITFAAHQESVNEDFQQRGAETEHLSYRFTMSEALFNDALDVALTWSDRYSWYSSVDAVRRDNRLTFDADLTPLPSWSFHAGWSRPIRAEAGAWSGSETASFQADWEQEMSFADLEVDYQFTWTRSLPGGTGEWKHEAEADVSVPSWRFEGWRFVPTANFSLQREDGATELGGKITVRSIGPDLSIRTTLQGELRGIGEPVLYESGGLTITANYTGIEDLRVSTTLTEDRGVTIYAGTRKVRKTHALNARLTWDPATGPYESFSFSLRRSGDDESRRVYVTLDNSYRYDISSIVSGWFVSKEREETGYPSFMLRADASADYQWVEETPSLSGTVTARTDVALSPTWSVALSTSYLTGMKTSGELYHSVLFEMTFAISF